MDLVGTFMLTGKVILIQEDEDELDVDISDFGEVTNIPVAYKCQDDEMEAVPGKSAFKLEDEVFVEWVFPPGYEDGDPPGKENLRVLGFVDGIHRVCNPADHVIAVYGGDYVVFYNCETGACHIPPPIDPSLIEDIWSGGTPGVNEWKYYQIRVSVVMAEFIDLVLGAEGEEITDTCMAGVTATLGAEVETETIVGPTDPTDLSGHLVHTVAPYASGAQGDTERPVTQSDGVASGTYYYHTWYKLSQLTITNKVAPLLLNGVDIMPPEWVSHYDDVFMDCATEPGEPARYTVNNYTNPGPHTIYSPCCFFHGGEYLPAYDDYGSLCPPTLCDCGGEEQQRCSHRQQHDRMYNRDQQILVDQNYTDFKEMTCFYLGEGDAAITLPTYVGMPTPAAAPVYSRGATTTKWTGHVSISKSNGTEGYLLGSREGCDWNWAQRPELNIAGVYPGGTPYLYGHFEEEMIAPTDEVTCVVGGHHDVWCYTTCRQHRITIFFNGTGHTVMHNVSQKQRTLEETIYKKDTVYRSVRVMYQETQQHDSVWWGGCTSYHTPTGDPPIWEDTTTTVQKFTREGSSHTLNGKLHQDRLLGFDLTHYATSNGWQEYPVVEPESVGTAMSIFSASRESDVDHTTEWAENRTNWDDSTWIFGFMEKLRDEAGFDSAEDFISSLGAGFVKFRSAIPAIE